MSVVAAWQDRLPVKPGTLPGVLVAALVLACSEFVRSGLYGAYLPQATGTLLGLPKADAVAVAATAFTIHFISDTVMRGPAGALISRFGVRAVMLAGAALSLLALGIMAETHTAWVLLLAAALHGVGFSAMWPGAMNLTADATRDSHKGRAVTAISLGVMPLIGAGFLLLGALAERPRALVFTIVLAVLAVALLAALFVPDRLRRAATAESQPNRRARLKTAVGALAPLFPAAFMQTLTMTLLGPLLFTLYRDLGLTYWGMVALLGTGGAVAFGSLPLTGKVADGGHARLAVTLGFALLALGLGGIATTPPMWALFVLAALVGVGYAFIMPGWAALVTGRLPEAERPAAWGALMTVENVGTSLGPLVGAFAYRTLGPTGPFITGASLALLTALGYVVFRHLLTTRHETGLEGGA
ncbi:multidrug transporter [Deinococcus radiopugnans]|uniref:Multidrug transporter n=2 Tax=Deinococcus radiopugnans TaxID=57497 RepID=A0A0A7KFI2_9DEIO|nr:MFS transporter [Deinococcus radiopugnans]AIZ43984.1 multidrug transporter [Deinococcus radiopugnans]MBB6017257.1 MFS family permease [Deinococcus radiopugnans ATCC 19172]